LTVEWTKRARSQLFAQLDYISLDKPSAADRMAQLVQESASMLSDWPELGKPGQVPKTRELVVAKTPFILVYSFSGKRVKVLRVLHGAQKYPK
jgi:toxin ParE1/3/4